MSDTSEPTGPDEPVEPAAARAAQPAPGAVPPPPAPPSAGPYPPAPASGNAHGLPGWGWALIIAGTAIVAFGAGVLLTLGGVFLRAHLGMGRDMGPGVSWNGGNGFAPGGGYGWHFDWPANPDRGPGERYAPRTPPALPTPEPSPTATTRS